MSSIWTPGGDVPSGPPEREPTPAELEAELAAMQAEIAGTPAEVIIANHAVGLFQLAAIHLNQRPPNLPEGRLAIDALAGMVDGVGDRLGEQGPAPREALDQLRMAFVQLAQQGGTAPPPDPGDDA